MTIQRGTQIAYVPNHANGDLTHPDVEFGFAMSIPGRVGVFCRYWRRGQPGALRTTACSELTPLAYLVEHESVEQWVVDNAIRMILEEQ
jgi:hypothetical protein